MRAHRPDDPGAGPPRHPPDPGSGHPPDARVGRLSTRPRPEALRGEPARRCATISTAPAHPRSGRRYERDEPTLLNLWDVLVPRKATATRHTTAMRATSRAYSTIAAPRSLAAAGVMRART